VSGETYHKNLKEMLRGRRRKNHLMEMKENLRGVNAETLLKKVE